LTFKGITYDIAAGGTDKKYIYWDPNYTTIFRSTNTLQDVFDVDGWVMCINESGVAYPAFGIKVIHGSVIQAGTLIVGTADIEDAAVTTAKIDNLAVTSAKIDDLAVISAKINDLAVNTAKIENLAVGTQKITDNAVTKPVSAYSASGYWIGTSNTTLQSASITATGAPVQVISCCCLVGMGGSTAVYICLYRDNTLIYEGPGQYVLLDYAHYATPIIQDTPPAGDRIYKLVAYALNANCCEAYGRSISVLEVKK